MANPLLGLRQVSSISRQMNLPDTEKRVIPGLIAQESNSGVGEILICNIFKDHNRCKPAPLGRRLSPSMVVPAKLNTPVEGLFYLDLFGKQHSSGIH